MRFGICNETYQDWPLEDAFLHAQQLGYQGIEIAPFTIEKDVREISAAKRKQIRDLAAVHELEVIGLHWLLAFTEGFYLTSPDEMVQTATTEYFRSLAKLCGDLGGKVMVLGSPHQRNLLPGVTLQDAMQIAAGVIEKAASAFQENNVVLALEPLGPEEGDFLLTADLAMELGRMIDHPNVKLHLDVKAMSTETKSIPDVIRENREFIAHFHANDPNKRGPGMGEVDFGPIFEALHEINYDKWISVEVFDYEPGVEKLAGDSIRYLRQFV